MKRYFLLLCLSLVALALEAQTATTKKENKPNVTVTADGNFVAIPKAAASSNDTKTDKTYTDNSGQVYPVYKTKNNKHYVLRVSKKSGKEYRYYLKLPGEK